MTRTTGTALVVDDDSDLRSLYRCWLAQSYNVRTAADGVDGLQRLDETVDVVLLDREMPRKGGMAVARDIDRGELSPAVVMISGVEPDLELLDASVDDYHRKPVTRDAVLASVRRARAVAEQPRLRRHLLSLDTRRRIVEDSVAAAALRGTAAYRRVVEDLERHSDTLAAARRDLPAPARPGGRERPDATPASTLGNSPYRE